MLDDVSQIWSLLAKYAVTGNAIALSLALIALNNSDADSIIKIGTTPLWIFFLGMIVGGLYAASFMAMRLLSTYNSVDNDLKEMESRDDLSLSHRAELTKLRGSMGTIAMFDKPQKVFNIIRGLQESLFLISYGLLLYGIYLIIDSIDVANY